MNFLVAKLIDRLGVRQEITQTPEQLEVRVETILGSEAFCLPFDGSETKVPGAAGGRDVQTSGGRASTREGLPVLQTVQAVQGSLGSREALLFETVRSLADGGATLREDVRVLRAGVPVACASRVLRRWE